MAVPGMRGDPSEEMFATCLADHPIISPNIRHYQKDGERTKTTKNPVIIDDNGV
jgi:hypothetical protein